METPHTSLFLNNINESYNLELEDPFWEDRTVSSPIPDFPKAEKNDDILLSTNKPSIWERDVDSLLNRSLQPLRGEGDDSFSDPTSSLGATHGLSLQARSAPLSRHSSTESNSSSLEEPLLSDDEPLLPPLPNSSSSSTSFLLDNKFNNSKCLLSPSLPPRLIPPDTKANTPFTELKGDLEELRRRISSGQASAQTFNLRHKICELELFLDRAPNSLDIKKLHSVTVLVKEAITEIDREITSHKLREDTWNTVNFMHSIRTLEKLKLELEKIITPSHETKLKEITKKQKTSNEMHFPKAYSAGNTFYGVSKTASEEIGAASPQIYPITGPEPLISLSYPLLASENSNLFSSPWSYVSKKSTASEKKFPSHTTTQPYSLRRKHNISLLVGTKDDRSGEHPQPTTNSSKTLQPQPTIVAPFDHLTPPSFFLSNEQQTSQKVDLPQDHRLSFKSVGTFPRTLKRISSRGKQSSSSHPFSFSLANEQHTKDSSSNIISPPFTSRTDFDIPLPLISPRLQFPLHPYYSSNLSPNIKISQQSADRPSWWHQLKNVKINSNYGPLPLSRDITLDLKPDQSIKTVKIKHLLDNNPIPVDIESLEIAAIGPSTNLDLKKHTSLRIVKIEVFHGKLTLPQSAETLNIGLIGPNSTLDLSKCEKLKELSLPDVHGKLTLPPTLEKLECLDINKGTLLVLKSFNHLRSIKIKDLYGTLRPSSALETFTCNNVCEFSTLNLYNCSKLETLKINNVDGMLVLPPTLKHLASNDIGQYATINMNSCDNLESIEIKAIKGSLAIPPTVRSFKCESIDPSVIIDLNNNFQLSEIIIKNPDNGGKIILSKHHHSHLTHNLPTESYELREQYINS